METIAQKIKDALFSFHRPSIIIAIGLFVFAIIIIGFQLLFGGSQGKEKAKETALISVIGLAVVIFAVELGQAIYSIFAGKSF